MVSIFSWGITFVIVFVNFLMARITYALIQWVKFANKSEEMGAIVKVLFLCYFFNTGISILIVNMNFKEQYPNELFKIFNGRYTDYSEKWYRNVGYMIY